MFIKGNKKDIFERMIASAANPLFCYPRHAVVDSKQYTDGSFYYPIPINKKLAKKKNIIVVLTFQPNSGFPLYEKLLEKVPNFSHLYKLKEVMIRKQEDLILSNDKIIKIIPSRPLFNNHFTTDNRKIRKTINLGIKDTQNILSKI